MQKLFFYSLILVVGCFAFADTDYTGEDRYVVFGIGESQAIAKRYAMERADKIAKQTGKKFEVVSESYSKFSGGTFWKCTLNVAFYNIFADMNQQQPEQTFRFPGLGESKETAITAAMERMAKFVAETGRELEVVEQSCEQLPQTAEWMCMLLAKENKVDQFPGQQGECVFRVPSTAKSKEKALDKAQKKVEKIAFETGKELKVFRESFVHFKQAGTWMCVLSVCTGDKPTPKGIRIPATGDSFFTAKMKAARKLREISEKTGKEFEVIHVTLHKCCDNLYFCMLSARCCSE